MSQYKRDFSGKFPVDNLKKYWEDRGVVVFWYQCSLWEENRHLLITASLHMSVTDILKEIPLFADLTPNDLESLKKCLTTRRFVRGQVLFHKGDEGSNLYIIKKGSVKVVLPSPQGEEVILALLTAGEVIGELSFIDGKERSATVEALENIEVLTLSRHDFLKFLSTRFDAVQRVFELLTRRLRNTDDLLGEAYFLDITSRVARKILALARQFGVNEGNMLRINVRVTQKELAAMIGATRESVNKQLRQFRENSLIDMQNGYFVILDAVRLSRRARTSLGSYI